jgi:hypothetical protein
MKELTVGEILRQNHQLDMARVDEMVAFCEAATKSGIDVDPMYRVSPPGDWIASRTNSWAGSSARARVRPAGPPRLDQHVYSVATKRLFWPKGRHGATLCVCILLTARSTSRMTQVGHRERHQASVPKRAEW